MKNLFIVVFILSLIFSCNIAEDMDDSVDLGNKYIFIQDYPQAIIFNTSKECKSCGRNIVPPNVLSYEFNERYIIAKSRDFMGEDKQLKYWIIDKKKDGAQVEPLDSISFYKQLKELKIDLKFKEVGNGK